jgi:hypothetical protein
MGQLALVEHVELLVDPLAGVEGVGGDGPGQHRGGRLVDWRPAQAPGGRDPGAQQGDGHDQDQLAPEHHQVVAKLHRSARRRLCTHRIDRLCPVPPGTPASSVAESIVIRGPELDIRRAAG